MMTVVELFEDAIASKPNIKIIASQTGDFTRAGGKQVMEAFLKSNPKIDMVFAHNDDMALGAIQAIEEAGLKPGKDILIVTIDAIKEAVQAVVDGKTGLLVEALWDWVAPDCPGPTPAAGGVTAGAVGADWTAGSWKRCVMPSPAGEV